MNIDYDKEADALYIKLTDKALSQSEEIAENIVVDFDEDNNVVGVEVLYFVTKHKQEFFPVFKQVEEAVWGFENSSEI